MFFSGGGGCFGEVFFFLEGGVFFIGEGGGVSGGVEGCSPGGGGVEVRGWSGGFRVGGVRAGGGGGQGSGEGREVGVDW